MKLFGTASFEDLAAEVVQILHQFEKQHLPGLEFEFGEVPEKVVVHWSSMVRLAAVEHMADLVAIHQNEPGKTLPPQELD
jgi:hypothetical protein